MGADVGFVRHRGAQSLQALKIFDGVAVHAAGLRQIAHEKRPEIGLLRHRAEALGETAIAILRVGDFDVAIADDGDIHEGDGPVVVRVERFIEGIGE